MHFHTLLMRLAFPHPLQTCVGGLSCHFILWGSLRSRKSEQNRIEASESISAHGWFDTARLLCWTIIRAQSANEFLLPFWTFLVRTTGICQGSLTESSLRQNLKWYERDVFTPCFTACLIYLTTAWHETGMGNIICGKGILHTSWAITSSCAQ